MVPKRWVLTEQHTEHIMVGHGKQMLAKWNFVPEIWNVSKERETKWINGGIIESECLLVDEETKE